MHSKPPFSISEKWFGESACYFILSRDVGRTLSRFQELMQVACWILKEKETVWWSMRSRSSRKKNKGEAFEIQLTESETRKASANVGQQYQENENSNSHPSRFELEIEIQCK